MAPPVAGAFAPPAFLSAGTTSVSPPALILYFRLSSIGSASSAPPFLISFPVLAESNLSLLLPAVAVPVALPAAPASLVGFLLSSKFSLLVATFFSSFPAAGIFLSEGLDPGLSDEGATVVLIKPSFLASAADIT